MENKERICHCLEELLRATYQYSHLAKAEYLKDKDIVLLTWSDGCGGTWKQEVYVAMDSGAEMIRDVIMAIR